MRRALDWLAHTFRTPTSYERSPWRYLRNQTGHAAVGVAAGATGLTWIAVAIYAVWEVAQMVRYGAEPGDALEDWLFVSLTAIAVGIGGEHLWLLSAPAALLAVGVLTRVTRREKTT